MAPCRAVPHGDDVAVSDEDGRFAVGDLAFAKMSRAGDDEQLVAEDIDLRQLAALDGVLHSEGMEIVALAERLQFVRLRIDQADPDEIRLVVGTADPLVDIHGPDAASVAVEMGRDHGHGVESCDGDVEVARAGTGGEARVPYLEFIPPPQSRHGSLRL